MGWNEVTTAAERNYGVITVDGALKHLTPDQVHHAVATRRLVPVFPGSYRVAGAPESWEQRVLCASLATGGVASHKTAARLWSISHVPSQRVEITVPASQV